MPRAPTTHQYDAEMLARQSEYRACCQRTAAHRFDCAVAAPSRREQPVRGAGRVVVMRRAR